MTTRGPMWTVTGPGVDVADPYFYTGDGYHEVWREARRAHPVAWTESPTAGGFWSVTGYREGAQILKNTKAFTSTSGMRLGTNPAGVAAASGRMLVVTDGERHRALHRVHSPWLSGPALARLLPDLARRLDERFDALFQRDLAFDAVQQLAVQLPAWALFCLLGVPGEDWARLAGLAATTFDDSDRGARAASDRTAAHSEILAYFAELLDRRRAEPGDDIVSALAQSTVDGEGLTDDEAILNCDGLINGGLETTPHAAAGALLAFHREPEQWRMLKADPALLDRAIEEILRFTSPPLHAMRTATATTTVGAAQVQRGDRIVVWIPSCNRDEAVFPDPGRFRIDRNPNPHLSFGGGPHYCIGATLARLELRCFLQTLVRRVAVIDAIGETRRKPSNFVHGLARMDVRLTPEPT